MRGNDYLFIEKDYEKHILVCLWIISMLLGFYFYFLLYRQYSTVSRELEQRKNVSVHQWIMSDTCSDQLTNSKDGILRIKLTK
jgi:hypothetical protein